MSKAGILTAIASFDGTDRAFPRTGAILNRNGGRDAFIDEPRKSTIHQVLRLCHHSGRWHENLMAQSTYSTYNIRRFPEFVNATALFTGHEPIGTFYWGKS